MSRAFTAEPQRAQRTGGGGRLARVVRDILRAERTMGMGKVSEVVRPGEIRLEGRAERVLVAGNVRPAVATIIPWLQVDRNLLVASYNVPIGGPAPLLSELDLGDIGVVADLLFGDGLNIGWYYYVACFPPDEGGIQMPSYNPGAPAWILTRQASVPLTYPSPHGIRLHYNVGQGSFHRSEEAPFYGYWFKLTFFDADDDSKETTPSIAIQHMPAEVGDYDYSVNLRLPSAGLARNGGVRVYCSTRVDDDPPGPYLRCFEFRGENTPGYDIYDHLDVTIYGPGDGPTPPTVNTLKACRVALEVFANETEEPTVMDQGIDRIMLYRTPFALPAVGGAAPPDVGYIGEVAIPVVPIQAESFCFIDDGIVAGASPDLPWPEES